MQAGPETFFFFFSVLRLCGSRQVVAQCCADERIIQVHILCPSLGSRKWSADLYAVRSLVRQKTTGKHKNNTKPKTKTQNPQNPAKRALTKTAPMGQATYVPMNSEILHRNKAGPETFNQQLCSPGSCHSVRLAKALRFVKAAPVLAKKVTAAILFSRP